MGSIPSPTSPAPSLPPTGLSCRDPDPAPLSHPLSLSQLLHRHAHERLLVPPLEWTARHLELLQCSFSQPAVAPPLREPESDSDASPRANEKAAWAARNWATSGPLFADRGDYIWHLLGRFSQHSILATRRPVRLRYGRRYCPDSRSFLSLLFEAAPSAPSFPVAIWTEFSQIDRYRRDAIGADRGEHNMPVWGTKQRRYKSLTPADRFQDPYLLALLISVAQEQRLILYRQGLLDRPVFQPHVLYTAPDDETDVHVYTADLPYHFLDQFDCPSFVPPARDPIVIRHVTVPFQPYDSLNVRLLAILTPTWYMDPLQRRQERIERVVRVMQGDQSGQPRQQQGTPSGGMKTP